MINSLFKMMTARPVSNTFRILQVLFIVLAQVGAAAFYSVQPALAAPIVAVDDGGADDQPGQKDLNALSVDYGTPGATTINVKWNWDSTATSGNNTRDAGALFDTDGDGFANFSLYVTVATNGSWTTQLYACAADNRTDRCSGPSLVTTFSSTANVETVANSDPFGVSSSAYFTPSHVTGNTCSDTPACYTADTVADTNIVLTDFGNPADVTLLNVCSYPSGEPNSDPSDCVFTPNSGFLTIVKAANPSDSTDFVFNASANSAGGDSSWTITGSGSVSLISYEATTTLDVNEVVPSGWQLDSASCVLQTSSPSNTGTPTATGVDNITIQSGVETICTFNDSLVQGTLTLVKVVDNLGESGTGYKSVSDFPLFIDGNSTTSGTPASVTAGSHTISETAQAGYTVGTWTCTDGTTGTAGSASATVNISGGENVTCTMTNTLVAAPALSLVKTATPTTYDGVGDVISYSYAVTNTGNVTLAGPVTVTDDKATVTCSAGGLAPGASKTCTASYTITQADIDSGSVKNTAQAHANGTDSNFDDETVTANQSPAILVVKASTTSTIATAGQVVPYTFEVSNEGNVTLTGITVTDPKCDTAPAYVSGDTNNDSKLQTTETWLYTCDHTVTQAEVDAGGNLTNTVTADSNESEPDTDTVNIPVAQSPALTLVKTATPSTYDGVGDVISYSYKVTNTGNVTLAGPVTVTDDKATVSCPTGGLAPGAFMTCTASYTITQADIDSGSVKNTAQAHANGTDSNFDDETVTAVQSPAIIVVKASTTTLIAKAGDVVPYTFEVSNTGNVTLSGITVTDPKCDAAPAYQSGDTNNDNKLQTTETWTYTCNHTVTQAEVDSKGDGDGDLDNTVTADSNESEPDTDTHQIPITYDPRLNVEKSSTTTAITATGQVVPYTFVVTNTGNVTLTGVTVTDPMCDAVPALQSGDANGDGNLDLDETWTYTCDHTVTQDEIDAGGNLSNTVTADSNESGPDTDSLDIPVSQSAALLVVKASTTSTIATAGQIVPYTFEVSNEGNVTLTGITVTDPKCDTAPAYVSGDTNNDNKLQTTETWLYTCDHTVTQAEVDAGGNLTNTVTADSNESEPDTDTVNIPVAQSPALTITKTADEETYSSVGDKIHYTIIATNTGNTTLASVTVTDPDVESIDCTPANGSSLAPGATMTCTATHTITQADIDAGNYANTACVDDGTGGAAKACDDEDVPADQSPALNVVKSVTSDGPYDSVGDVITYNITVTNTGNLTLTGVTVTDAGVGAVLGTCTPSIPTTLAPGASVTCAASHEVTQADLNAGFYTNVATGDSDQTDPDTDDETVPTAQNPALSIVKTATEQSYDSVGDVINYTIVATNTGNTTLTSVTVTDANISNLNCNPANGSSLDPGASMTCSASHTINQADIDAGSYANTACVDDGTGGAAKACDDEDVPATQSPALSLTKSASPASYFAAGQVITYTYVITNSGNVTLNGPFTITDDKTTVTCPATSSLAPNATITCTATYTIQPGDLNASNTGSVTNTATATNGTVTSNQAQATVNQVAATGQIAPTATTCQDFKNGTAGNLTEILYGLKGNKINNVAPGVLFYYSLVTVPAGTHTISVTQTTSPNFTLFGIQQDQAILWSSNCTKVTSNATGSFSVTTTTTTTYIIGIKYDPGTVVGKTKPAGNGQVTYTFSTFVNGSLVATSPDSLVLKQKPK